MPQRSVELSQRQLKRGKGRKISRPARVHLLHNSTLTALIVIRKKVSLDDREDEARGLRPLVHHPNPISPTTAIVLRAMMYDVQVLVEGTVSNGGIELQ